jgi:hypothetical protein
MVAIALGALAGYGVAEIAISPVLHMFSRGSINNFYTEPSTPVVKFIRFAGVFMLGGVLVGTSAWGATRYVGRFHGALWTMIFSAVFGIGAFVALGVELAMWNPTAPPIAGLGAPLVVPLESVPISTIPVGGCLAVILAVAVVMLAPAIRCRARAKDACLQS